MMGSKMEVLVTVSYRHGYFKDQLCPWLSVRPGENGHRELLNHGMLLRPGRGGFQLLYDTLHAGNQRTRTDILAMGNTIRLLLRLNDPFFYNYTYPVPADITNQHFYFYNRPGQSFLHAAEQASGEDLVLLEKGGTGLAEKPFAVVDLRLEEGLEENCHIFFRPQSTWWNYILVGEHLTSLNNPAIINRRTKELFVGPTAVVLPDQRAALSFVSPVAIDLNERPAWTCSLVENFDSDTGRYKVVVNVLPSPAVEVISGVRRHNAPGEKESNFSEIFLY